MDKSYGRRFYGSKGLGISLCFLLVASVTSIAFSASKAEAFTGNCANIAVKNFWATALEDGILGKREKAPKATTLQASYVSESLTYMKMHGLNAIRVPFYWEAYVNNPTLFLQEVDLIAKTAQSKGMCVVFSNFHYHTSSYWSLDGGRGFPSFAVNDFPKKYDYKATAGPFWEAFLGNNIMIGGKKVWDVQWDYPSKVVNKVKGYNSVAGFEILNEPHLFNKGMYDKLGNYHTFMAKKIRAITDKKIFFDRETAWGFSRDPNLEPRIKPDGVGKLVYAAQLYAVPTTGSVGMKQLNNFKTWSTQWGTEVFVCEWAGDTKSEDVTFLKAFKEKGFGWSYHSWKKKATGLGGALYDSDSTAPTSDLMDLKAAMQTVY